MDNHTFIFMKDLKKYIAKLISENLESSSYENSEDFKKMKKAIKDRGYKYEGKRELIQGPQYMFSKPIGDAFAVIAFGLWKGVQVASGTVIKHDMETGKPEPKDIYSGPMNYVGLLGMLDLMKKEEAIAVDRYLGIGGGESEKERNPLRSKDFKSKESKPLAKAGLGYSLQFNENENNMDLLMCAKKLQSINFKDVITFLNEKDVDYSNWRDLDMIVYYLENGGDKESDESFEDLNEEWEE
jgi:hypothetical protein